MVCPAVTFPADGARHISSLGKMQACLRGIVVVFECLLQWLDVKNPYWGSIQNPHLWCFFAGPGQILPSTFDPPRLCSTKVPARSHMARIRMAFFRLVAAFSFTSSFCIVKECQELDLCFNIKFQVVANEDNSCSHSWFFSLRHGGAFW